MPQPQSQSLCRRCLLKESQGGDLYRSIMEYIDAIPLEEKSCIEAYNQRLEICKICDHLTNGMCALCGCFVEVRAAKSNQRCAGDFW
ncbi:MAG: DUF6171 family protein [Defluviitaleaceae bacterium]|nr:DUF6171 family protein [Defluviitaleaceae bacterium]